MTDETQTEEQVDLQVAEKLALQEAQAGAQRAYNEIVMLAGPQPNLPQAWEVGALSRVLIDTGLITQLALVEAARRIADETLASVRRQVLTQGIDHHSVLRTVAGKPPEIVH